MTLSGKENEALWGKMVTAYEGNTKRDRRRRSAEFDVSKNKEECRKNGKTPQLTGVGVIGASSWEKKTVRNNCRGI